MVDPASLDSVWSARPAQVGADRDDLQLVRRAQRGDRRAFDQLVRKYRPRLFALALRFTRDPSDAEDAAQEALMKAYRGLQQFRCECALYTWLYRITINSAKNLVAARLRDQAIISSGLPEDLDAGDFAPRLQDLATPEHLTLTEDIRSTVRASVQALPEVHRTAILLREIEGMSYEQIGEALAIPVGTVRSRVFRARELIDRQLREVCEGGLGRQEKRRGEA